MSHPLPISHSKVQSELLVSDSESKSWLAFNDELYQAMIMVRALRRDIAAYNLDEEMVNK